MPTPPQPDPTPNSARNLFLDADPIDYDTLTEPDGPASKNVTPRQQGRGRGIAVDNPSSVAVAPSRRGHAARFTRPTAGIATLRRAALRNVDRAAVLAGRRLARVAARPYAALTAFGVLAVGCCSRSPGSDSRSTTRPRDSTPPSGTWPPPPRRSPTTARASTPRLGSCAKR